jgi:NAD-dependent deacetylase
VPTFREAQTGHWEKYEPLELATPGAFERDPELVWRWYQWRRELVANAAPNAGHRALAELASLVPRLTLVTQNVDGLHQRAGSRDVIEFHGNIFANRCFADGRIVEAAEVDGPPTCPDCGARTRPGVVWFGEAIPEEALHASFAAAGDCDVFLSVGTSALVYPAAGLADVAIDAGAITIEVNPSPTGQSDSYTASLRGNAGVVLPKLVESLAH